MPGYRIFQLRPEYVLAFQEKAPKPGKMSLRDGRYEETGAIDADSAYEAWKLLQDENRPENVRRLAVGDVLQIDDEDPMVCAWWGFETAQWMSAEQEAIETHEEVDVRETVSR
jgi:hypothetical protein